MSEARAMEFQAEIRQLLDIVIHSLYTEKDVFLRELVSNASDAIDKRRFLSLTDASLAGDDLHIRLVPDATAGTLTISDDGVGMTQEEVVANIGTIARSGSRAFLEQLKKAGSADKPELIGQFGVGFYASFMVADKVTLVTRKVGTDAATVWESTGEGGYTVADGARATPGTDVILHLRRKDGDKEVEEGWKDYTQEWVLKDLVRRYSDFVTHPIRMEVEKDGDKDDNKDGKKEWQTLNSMKAIWTRPKTEVKAEEYAEFYKQLTHDFADPLEVVPFSAEGVVEYKALLFLPARRPHDMFWRDGRRGLNLYVKRIFIMADCEKLLPDWLRFVRGLVDAADLPLNISREMVQQDRQIEAIRKRLTKKVLEVLKQMKEADRPKYLKFWAEFGQALKEGVAMDFASAEDLKELILFTTTTSAEPTDFAAYAGRMPEEQKEIYYITGDSMATVAGSPLLEAFKAKGREVILLADRVDEFMVQGLHEYKGRKLRSVNKGDVDLQSEEEKKAGAAKEQERKEQFAGLLAALQDLLKDQVKEVRFSQRLKESAACLVADEKDMGLQMEQIFRQMGQEVPKTKRILELNPEHGIVSVLGAIYAKNRGDARIARYARLLHDQALLAEGLPVENPAAFAREVADLMVAANKEP